MLQLGACNGTRPHCLVSVVPTGARACLSAGTPLQRGARRTSRDAFVKSPAVWRVLRTAKVHSRVSREVSGAKSRKLERLTREPKSFADTWRCQRSLVDVCDRAGPQKQALPFTRRTARGCSHVLGALEGEMLLARPYNDGACACTSAESCNRKVACKFRLCL